MKLDRLIGILSLLLQREKVTAPELAERFEVSRRTIQRDLEALSKAGIPLVTTQGAGGGISIMEGYRVNRTVLTAPEMQAILAGLRSLDSVSGTRRYDQLMEKLSAGSHTLAPGNAHVLIDLASWYKDSLAPKIEALRGAMDDHRVVCFSYFAPGRESQRTVEPYYLVFHWSAWYLWGWCRSREDFRLFKLVRMTELSVGEEFAPREVPLPDFDDARIFPTVYQAVVQARAVENSDSLLRPCGMQHPRRQFRPYAGICQAASCGWHPMGQRDVHERKASGVRCCLLASFMAGAANLTAKNLLTLSQRFSWAK